MQYQMPPELTKEERAMLNELPPLPRSDYTDNGGFGQDRALALFTGSQMRSYALEAVRLERELRASAWIKAHGFDKHGVAKFIATGEVS